VTYRFYDYGRLENGKPRQLHIAQSLDVTTVPYVEGGNQPQQEMQQDAKVTHLVSCPYYSVYRVELDGSMEMDWKVPFVNVSILNGEGKFDGQPVKKGDHFLICADYGQMQIEGEVEFIYSHI
jgi:mannose-6-phosphate isomerase class I